MLFKDPITLEHALTADLFGCSGPVLLDAPASGSRNSVPQIQISRVFGGNSVAAPPEEAVLIRSIV